MCGFREGYALKIFNSTKFKMADLQPLLTLLCVISGKPCQIARLLPQKLDVRFQGGICPEKFQLDEIRNGLFVGINDFICVVSGKNVLNSWTIIIKQNFRFQ